MMTLEEAIRHCEEVAERHCDECGDEHRQLAEWLRELQAYRKERNENAGRNYRNHDADL